MNRVYIWGVDISGFWQYPDLPDNVYYHQFQNRTKELKMNQLTEQVSGLKIKCEEVCGKPLDPFYNSADNSWELRYVNHGGIHIFSIWLRHNGKNWRIATVGTVAVTGALFEIM